MADESGARTCFATTVEEAKDVILAMLKKGGWSAEAEASNTAADLTEKMKGDSLS